MKNIFLTIKFFLIFILFYVCKIIGGGSRRKSNRIIFAAWLGNKYDDNPKALFEYTLKHRQDLDVCWLTTNDKIYNELKSKGLPVHKTHSLRGLYYCLTAKYYCYCVWTTDLKLKVDTLLNGIIFINLWHGVPLKKVGFDNHFAKEYNDKVMSRYNKCQRLWIDKKDKLVSEISKGNYYHMATSEAMGKIYEGVFGSDSEHVLILGQSRNDYFFTEHNNPIAEEFAGYRRVVYMPTHRKEGRQIIEIEKILDLESINKFCADNNIMFLIKKHFYHREESVISDNRFSNIKELTQKPIKTQELVDSADILITDYSGVYIDYILLDRPMIFYAYDFEEYMATDRDMYLPYTQEYIPGRICKTQKDVEEELANLIAGTDNFVDVRNKMKDYYYSKQTQGRVAGLQLDKILSIN